MTRICLIALIGLPAVGKTTLSYSLLKVLQCRFNTIHLCYDKFLEFDNSCSNILDIDYKSQRLGILQILQDIVPIIQGTQKFELKMLDKFKVCYTSAQNSQDFVIICDDNHYYRSMRYKLYQFSRNYNLSYAQIYIKSDLPTSLERNATRVANIRIPDNIIKQMFERFEYPSDFFASTWESNVETLILETVNDFSEIAINIIYPFISAELKNVLNPPSPPKSKKEKKHKLDIINRNKSIVHELDILLRENVREIMLGAPEGLSDADKKERAMKANKERKELLQRVEYMTRLRKS